MSSRGDIPSGSLSSARFMFEYIAHRARGLRELCAPSPHFGRLIYAPDLIQHMTYVASHWLKQRQYNGDECTHVHCV